MTRSSWVLWVIRAVGACTLLACGGGGGAAFGLTFPDNRPEQLGPVLARLAATRAPSEVPVAVSLGGTPTELVAFDLAAGEVRWRQPAESTVAPQIAGRLVFTHEAPALVARDLATGTVVFREEDGGLSLIGAAGEGDLAVAVLSTGGGVGARTRLVVARGGDVSWVRDLEMAFGVPAVRAGMLFLPWANQNLSVLDGESGDELVRLRISDEVIGHAISTGDAVYTGQNNLFRVTESTTRGTRDGAAWFGASVGDLPGTPAFLRDAYAPPPSPQSALHRVRLDFRPGGEGETVSLSDDNLYLTYYRLVFALDPATGDVRWARQHEVDVVGGSAQPGGLIVADASGGLTLLSATDGRPTWRASSELPSLVTSLRLGDFAPTGTSTEEAMNLADQLSTAAQNPDARLTPAQVFAVIKMSTLESSAVTANLITLCDRQQLPAEVRRTACDAMGARVEGPEQLLAALERHARFLEGTTSPPVGALARAAARMEETRAVPLLISHLRDPATPGTALLPLLDALGALGDRDAANPIRDFLRLYHADGEDDDLVVALGAGIEALVLLEGPVARPTLDELAADPLGVPQVRGKARDAAAALDEADAEARDRDTARDTPTEEESTASGEGDSSEELPMTITSAIVADALAPVQRELGMCLSNANGRPRSARLILRLAGNGSIETASVTPQIVAACVEPLVRAQTFPANRRGVRQQVIHTIRR